MGMCKDISSWTTIYTLPMEKWRKCSSPLNIAHAWVTAFSSRLVQTLCSAQCLAVHSVYTCSAVCTAVYSYLASGWPQYCQPIIEEHQGICFALIGPIYDWRWRRRRRIAICWSHPLSTRGPWWKVEWMLETDKHTHRAVECWSFAFIAAKLCWKTDLCFLFLFQAY